jgi:UPF0042 nucleotide-binding protein
MSKIKVVIVTGLSGSGKTKAADWFEDHGYYCIDNMPPALIKNFLELSTGTSDSMDKAAFVMDIRSEDFFNGLNRSMEYLKSREDVESDILFVEASDSALIKRYNETRRNHPLSTGRTSKEVIETERNMLADLRARATHVLDTTNLSIPGLNLELSRIYEPADAGGHPFSLNILSFGFKYGVPEDTDMVFDARFIPNPYYVKSLRHLTGNNKKVQKYVLKYDITKQFCNKLLDMIKVMAPYYAQEGKNHLNIAFGCTGGQHRSVTLANEMGRIFREQGFRVTVDHREL